MSKSTCFLLVCLVIMSAFAYSYMQAYNTKLIVPYKSSDDNKKVSNDMILTVNKETYIVMEVYDLYKEKIYETDFEYADKILNKSRTQLVSYLDILSEEINKNKKEEGFIDYQLIYFGDEKLVIRKNINTINSDKQFLIKDDNGYIVVFSYPDMQYYHQTGILITSVDKNSQNKLSEGIYASDMNELYSILESFSS